MDLKNTINNTNIQKENIKTVANKIDNKLVELGGERATDLNDVANKMGAMVGQYKKFAVGGKQRVQFDNYPAWNECKINMNLDFVPEIIICTTWMVADSGKIYFNGTADSRYNRSKEVVAPWTKASFYIKGESITKKDFTLSMVCSGFDEDTFDIAWFALG